MSKLTPELKTDLLNELCYGNLYGKDNCSEHFKYVGQILNRDKTLLIGDYVLSEEQLDDLYEIVSSMYSTGIRRHTNDSVALTVLAIVNICRDFDLQGEEGYYGFIQKKLFRNSPRAADWLSNLKIYDVMKLCFGHLSKHILFGTVSRTSYYSTILCQAIAPKSSFFALLDALWFIHNERVDDTYFEEDYGDIADAFKAFFSLSKDDDAGISIGSQSYAIRSGLRYCAIQDRELFIGILKRAFGLLSLYYDNGGEDDKNRDSSYFVQLFEEWYHTKQSSIGIGKKSVTIRREPTVRDYRTAKIKYAFDAEKQIPYLAFPQMRLLGYSEDRPVLIVESDGQIIETRNLELGGNEFMRVIRPFRIDLTKFELHNLELTVTVRRGNETLYSSGNEFKRDLLLFAGEKEILGNRIEKGFYTAFILADGDYVFNTCRELCRNTYSVQFDVGDDFDIGYNRYHIIDSGLSSKASSSVSVIGRKVKGAQYLASNVEYPIYSSITEINYNKGHNNEIRINVSGKHYTFENFSVSDCISNDFCLVRIWDSASFEAEYEFAILNNFSFNFDQKYYYNESGKNVLRYSLDGATGEIPFHIGDERIDVSYREGSIEFSIPTVSWSISGVADEIRIAPKPKPIWYEDIKQNAILRIEVPSACIVKAYNLAGELKSSDENGGFLLGQAAWGNENKQTTGVDIVFITVNEERHKICEIAYYPQIAQKPQIICDSRQKLIRIDFSAGYVGPAGAKFAYEFDNGELTSFESSANPALFNATLEKDVYRFRMYWLKTQSTFGFSGMPQKVLVYESEFSNGKPEELRFVHKTLCIADYVDFDNVAHGIGTTYYVKNLCFSQRLDGFDQYTCEIFRDTWKGLVPLQMDAYMEIIKNGECLLYFYDREYECLSEFIFRKENGFILKHQGEIPSSQFISSNYLKYKEVD